MKILLVDDSDFMRTILKAILQKSFPDAVLEEANTGLKALEKYRQTHHDIILLDLIMPQMGGAEVLQEIGHEANVIVISANGHGDAIDEARQLGAKDFIIKPFDAKEVTEKIQQTLSLS